MPADLKLEPEYSRWTRALVWWRSVCQQWRQCYLLLIFMFWFVWRFSSMAIPVLENTRFMGGLHPINVLLLMKLLKPMWLLPFVPAVLYALSFAIRSLNTA